MPIELIRKIFDLMAGVAPVSSWCFALTCRDFYTVSSLVHPFYPFSSSPVHLPLPSFRLTVSQIFTLNYLPTHLRTIVPRWPSALEVRDMDTLWGETHISDPLYKLLRTWMRRQNHIYDHLSSSKKFTRKENWEARGLIF